MENLEENINHDDKIKQVVNEYLIGLIKARFPNLSKENEEIFKEKISATIDEEIERKMFMNRGIGPRGLNCDNRPSPELEYAFCSMDFGEDWPEYRMAAAAYNTFPHKMSISVRKGKYALASDGYNDTKYLYMSEEYKEQQLAKINAMIERELSKVPNDKMEQFEQEYKQKLEQYNNNRTRLLEKKTRTEELSQKELMLKQELEDLMANYSQRIDEIDKMELSESEKQAKKESILKETNETKQKAEACEKESRAEISKMQKEYGYITIEMFEEIKGEIVNKDKWMIKKIGEYSREEYKKIMDEFKNTPNVDIEKEWPNTDHLPSDLDKYYDEKKRIENYTGITNRQTQEIQEKAEMTQEQNEIMMAFVNAYCDYVKIDDSYVLLEHSQQKESVEKLREELKCYFERNFNIIQDVENMKKFEDEALKNIARRCGFTKNREIEKYRRNDKLNVRFEDGILICKQNYDQKIYYGKIEDVEKKIEKLESKQRFLKDIGSWHRLSIEENSILEGLQEYKTEKTGNEKSLMQLDAEKANLEEREIQARELLERYNNEYVFREGIGQEEKDDQASLD